jgi:hypothetical protein
MKLSRFMWPMWWIAPVIVLFLHFGPGQRLLRIERAAEFQRRANKLEHEAQSAQDRAYELHLALAAAAATEAEESAYETASIAWKAVADELSKAIDALGVDEDRELESVRISRARALVRSGDVWGGISELETIVQRHATSHGEDHTQARSELATAYYYAARLLRLSGMPAQEWMIESGLARQNFKYLAEGAAESNLSAEESLVHQRNLELVLNLEQSDRSELMGKPLPRNSPGQGQQGNRPGPGRKSKRPPEQRDGRGAGGAQDIPPGW